MRKENANSKNHAYATWRVDKAYPVSMRQQKSTSKDKL
jgi:hypothetical protein